MTKTKLWIFGPSMCMAHGVSYEQSWPNLLAKRINAECVNHAQNAADNFFIYSCYAENKKNIAPHDTVIVGWAHPSRKSFVIDETNPLHQEVVQASMVYKTPKHKFMRSRNPVDDSFAKWAEIFIKSKGNKFYDNWFMNYYSEYEQNTNFQSYQDSVAYTVPCCYLPFYFSKESVTHVTTQSNLFYLEFALENGCSISVKDYHFNEHGHQLFVDAILPFLKQH